MWIPTLDIVERNVGMGGLCSRRRPLDGAEIARLVWNLSKGRSQLPELDRFVARYAYRHVASSGTLKA